MSPEDAPGHPGASSVRVDPASFIDPGGFVFHEGGRVYRAIAEASAPFYRALLESGEIGRLQRSHGLVASQVAPRALAGFPLVLEHERVWPVTYCVEWCPSMLRDAGRATLELALDLNDRDLTLQDAYPWNVLFRGAEPVFVDVTSIVPVSSSLAWPAYEQFQGFFIRPLRLAAVGAGDVARALLQNNISGVGVRHLYRILGPVAKLRHPGVPVAYFVERMLARSTRLSQMLAQSVKPGTRPPSRAVRARLFQALLAGLPRPPARPVADSWSGYYGGSRSGPDSRSKLETVAAVLERLQPATVLDIGCNTGRYSVAAAERGARVVALDSSEASVERLHETARRRRLAVTALVADVLCPTPPLGFLNGEFPSLVDRVKCDLVLCLGLMHHLHVAARQPLARIAALLSALASRHIVLEFVDAADDNVRAMTRSGLVGYDLQAVCEAMRQHASHIEVLPSDRDTRRLLVCTR